MSQLTANYSELIPEHTYKNKIDTYFKYACTMTILTVPDIFKLTYYFHLNIYFY